MSNIYDAFEPFYKMQESLRKMTAPYDSAMAIYEQIHRAASIVQPFSTAELIAQHYPALSAMQNILQGINFPQFHALSASFSIPNPFAEFLTQTQGALEAISDSEMAKSLIGTKSALQELSFRIQEITFQDANVYFPEQLIPDDYIFDAEPECIEYKIEANRSKSIKIKKLTPRDAFDIICNLIAILFAIIGILQAQMSPTQEQVQELIEKQSEQNELLQKNNELIQMQIDATLQASDYLVNILSELQPVIEDIPLDSQQSPEHFADEDSDSQQIDLNLYESQLESPLSSDELDVHDTH